LYLYLVDHGGNQKFQISSKTQEVITAAQLNNALDEFQTKTTCPVVLIIEACYSGSFVDALTNDRQSLDRAVITSSDWDEQSMIESAGSVSFTRFLFRELSKGRQFDEALKTAENKLASDAFKQIYKKQSPQSYLAGLGDRRLGSPYAIADYAPASETSKFLEVNGEDGITIDETSPSSILLSAKIFFVTGIKRVWATALPPSYEPPSITDDFVTTDLSAVTVELVYNQVKNQYEAVHDLKEPLEYGTYTITYFLEEIDGNIISNASTESTEEDTDEIT
ncbi:MAG: hypothetical protein DRH26_13330, partial [Deltaproteobacteria bacterium]